MSAGGVSSETAVRVCLLGKPGLFIDGRLRPFGGPRKAIALLAYVLLHRDRALMRAAVAERFWPDDDDEDARTTLRRHLHRALAALPDAPPARPWILADKVTLRWNPEAALAVDTDEYERCCRDGDLDAAVALYRGDYLEDFYDEWILPERERLRALQAANLIALVDARRRALDYPGAIAYAQAILRLDPLREDALRRLMSLRFASGDRSGALGEFEAFARRLHDELAAEPMPETLALRASILGNEHRTDVGGGSRLVTAAQPGFPFVGRRAAFETLHAAWETAARGSATIAIVSGEAGIGKSRLVGELASTVEAQGGRVLAGATATIEAEPYQPIAEALRGALPLFRFDRLDARALAALSALVPEVRTLANGVPHLPALEPDRDRRRLFDAVETALVHLCETRPLVLVVEDIHWAGAATIDLLAFLAQGRRTMPFLAVVTFREEAADANHALRAFVRGLDAGRVRHVALGPLEERDVRDLVRGVVSGADGEVAAVARDLFVASDGNALFVTELLRARTRDTVAASVLPRIADMVAARVEGLSPHARILVETAAVIGVGFDVEVVRHVGNWSFADVFDGLDEVLDRALVRASPKRRGEFAFSHQLVHAAVYAPIDDATRTRLHRRVAKTLEALFPERASLLAVIARHYDRAGFAGDAVARYLAAARHALDVFAQAESIALATRAVELADDDRTRFAAHGLREEAHRRSGEATARAADCGAMIELAERLGDDELLGTALTRTITLHRQLGERREERAAIDRLRALGERCDSPRWGLEYALAQARMDINTANLPAAADRLRDAESLAARVDDAALVLEFWVNRANAALGTPAARDYVERGRPFAAHDPMLRIRWLRAQANVADSAGDPPTLARVAAELLERNIEIGDLDGQASAHLQLALGAWYRLDVAAAREHNRAALELFERVRKPNSIAAVLINRGVVAQRLGDFDGALADYERARAIAEGIEQHGTVYLALINVASVALMREDFGRARHRALEALAYARDHRLEGSQSMARDFVGRAERELGNLTGARDHLVAALQYRRAHDRRGVLETLSEIVPVYVRLGDVAAAAAAADELLSGLEGDRMRATFPAKALAAAASAYDAAGRVAEAAALRTEARLLLDELAARIDDPASRAGYLSHPFHRAILAGTSPPNRTT